MATSAGVGKSKDTDPFEAGRCAAQMALDQAGVGKGDFVFLFSTVGYDQNLVLKGVRSVTGDTPLSGGSAGGIITQDGPEGEISFALSDTEKDPDIVGVMIISSDEIRFTNFLETGLKENSLTAGVNIGRKINDSEINDPLFIMMFPDSYTTNITNFFHGIETTLKNPLPCAGGLTAHTQKFSTVTYQYHNDQVLKDAVSCILVSGNVKVEIGVNHGCLPIGIEKTVTKAKENTVFEIENKNIWKYFQEYLGDDIESLNTENSPAVSIGLKLPDGMATEYDEYVLRAPLLKNPDGSIRFGTEIKVGDKVQLVRRDEKKISEGASAMAQRIKNRLGGKKPVAVLHFDCASRGKMFFGDDVKAMAIDVLQDKFGKYVPWLGFFCFGEVAPIAGVNYYHNNSVVLCVFYN